MGIPHMQNDMSDKIDRAQVDHLVYDGAVGDANTHQGSSVPVGHQVYGVPTGGVNSHNVLVSQLAIKCMVPPQVVSIVTKVAMCQVVMCQLVNSCMVALQVMLLVIKVEVCQFTKLCMVAKVVVCHLVTL